MVSLTEAKERERGRPLVVNLERMAEFAQNGIVSKTIVDEQYAKTVLFCMATGQSLSEHTVSVPAAIHILAGHGQVTLGEEQHEAKAGVWIHMPAETRHAVQSDYNLVFLLTLYKPED